MKKYKIQDLGTGCIAQIERLLRRTLVRSEVNWAKWRGGFYFTLILLLLCISSCTKVISLKLNEGDKKIVIEGNVSNNDTILPEVKISTTKAFEDDNSFVGISGATVTIQEMTGRTYTLTEDSAGIYHSHDFRGIPGFSYRLSVALNGNTYTASSTLPAQTVTLDSLWVQNLAFGGSSNLTIYPEYTDPPGLGNSYRLIEYKNGVQVNQVFEENDELSDGLTITRPLINPDGDLQPGDTVRVTLQCIDPAMYTYWFSAEQSATGENQSATPVNPVTNITGGALGFFSAHSESSRVIVVK